MACTTCGQSSLQVVQRQQQAIIEEQMAKKSKVVAGVEETGKGLKLGPAYGFNITSPAEALATSTVTKSKKLASKKTVAAKQTKSIAPEEGTAPDAKESDPAIEE